MNHKKIALRGLMACAWVTSLMAISASPASGSGWMVNGTNISTLLPSLLVQEIESNDASFLTKIAGVKVEMLCTALELMGAKLAAGGKVASGARGQFTGCVMKLNDNLSSPCEPHTGAEKGTIYTALLKGSLGGETISLEPEVGEVFKTLEMGKECAIGSKMSTLGKVTLKDSALATEAVTHLLSADPATAMWAISKTVEHQVTLDGSATAALSGEHKGLKWSGLP